MRNDKLQAIKLRKQGKSYKEIQEILKIPKSTLSYWLRDVELSKKSQDKIMRRSHRKSVEALIKRNKQ